MVSSSTCCVSVAAGPFAGPRQVRVVVVVVAEAGTADGAIRSFNVVIEGNEFGEAMAGFFGDTCNVVSFDVALFTSRFPA